MQLSRRYLLGATLALPAARARAAPRALIMATGRPGGYYAAYGPAWGTLAEREAGIRIAYRASGGAAADILLLEQTKAELGMTTVTVAAEASQGTGAWTGGVKFTSFRALFPMFPSILQIISPCPTGITTLPNLAGQIIGIGPDGGSGAATVPAIFAALGIAPARLVNGEYAAQVRAMNHGEIAACAFIGAPPVAALARAAMSARFSLIGFSETQAAAVTSALPGMSGMVLPAGSFPGQSIAVASVGTDNFVIGAASLPDDIAAAITLAALRNRARLAAVVPAAAQVPQVGPVLQGAIKFHPGAAAALRNVGLAVPAGYVEG